MIPPDINSYAWQVSEAGYTVSTSEDDVFVVPGGRCWWSALDLQHWTHFSWALCGRVDRRGCRKEAYLGETQIYNLAKTITTTKVSSNLFLLALMSRDASSLGYWDTEASMLRLQ
jgi:hypothetical protein